MQKFSIWLWFPKNIGSSEAHGESPQPYQIHTSFLKRKETMMAKKKEKEKKATKKAVEKKATAKKKEKKNKGKKKGKGKK
jgi:hypothetical protein